MELFYVPWDLLIQSEEYLQNLSFIRKSWGRSVLWNGTSGLSSALKGNSGGEVREKLSPCISFGSLHSSGRSPAPLAQLLIVRVWEANQFDVHFHQQSRSNAPRVGWKWHYVLRAFSLCWFLEWVESKPHLLFSLSVTYAFRSLAHCCNPPFPQPKTSIISIRAF